MLHNNTQGNVKSRVKRLSKANYFTGKRILNREWECVCAMFKCLCDEIACT